MSSYDFIIDGIRFSYSSVSTFETCPHSFKLTYLEVMPREQNFYAEFGTLVHECLEKFFSGELDTFDLSNYYRRRYNEAVTTPAPTPPYGLDDKYRQQGQDFFDNFSFPLHLYDIVLIEDKVNLQLHGGMFTARPDLVLSEKVTGKKILYDYKTSAPFKVDKRSGKETRDKKKLEGYYKQMFTYTHALRTQRNIAIDEITLWFPRLDRMVSIPWTLEKEEAAVAWLRTSIEKIRQEEVFPYNNTQAYFCNNLCSVRKFCEYR